jgi:hypothetical protein
MKAIAVAINTQAKLFLAIHTSRKARKAAVSCKKMEIIRIRATSMGKSSPRFTPPGHAPHGSGQFIK